MIISARLEESTVKAMLDDLLPLTVLLDEPGDGQKQRQRNDRWIRIDPARVVDFVADDGLRVEVGGHIQWKTAGVPLPLTITSAQLLLRPSVVEDQDGGRLVFQPALEKVDLKNIPGFLDSGIASLVNKRLAGEGDKLSWSFGKTLRSTVAVSDDLVEIQSFDLSAGSGVVRVLHDAIVFSVGLTMHFTRRPG